VGYIGVTPEAGFTTGLLDRFTSTTGTTVTLTHEISSENDIIVFVNFVKQDSTNYSVGGSGNKTLTLGGTLVSSDVVEVHYLNIVNQTSAPSADSVGSSQITADVITGQTALASTPADTDEFLVSDAGTLKRIDYSLIKGGGITEADTWMVTATFSNSSNGADEVKTSNWARQVAPTYGSFDKIGTGMSESSGIFSFPSTGIYHVTWNSYFDLSQATSGAVLKIQVTNNGGSNYVNMAVSGGGGDANRGQTLNAQTFVDVTNTSNVKVRFLTNGATYINWFGDANATYTYATFVRLGDT